MVPVQSAIRRRDQRAVSLVQQYAAHLTGEQRQLALLRIFQAGQTGEFPRVRRKDDRLCRLPQYILMRGQRIYTIRVQYHRARGLREQVLHHRRDRIPPAEAASAQNRAGPPELLPQQMARLRRDQPVRCFREQTVDRLEVLPRHGRIQ